MKCSVGPLAADGDLATKERRPTYLLARDIFGHSSPPPSPTQSYRCCQLTGDNSSLLNSFTILRLLESTSLQISEMLNGFEAQY